MPDRPYKCPLCSSAFRNESGMKWHLAHRHEIPAAFDALGKDYESKTANLQEENSRLQNKLEHLNRDLDNAKISLLGEYEERAKSLAQVVQLHNDLQKAIIAIAACSKILKEELNIDMPNPFK